MPVIYDYSSWRRRGRKYGVRKHNRFASRSRYQKSVPYRYSKKYKYSFGKTLPSSQASLYNAGVGFPQTLVTQNRDFESNAIPDLQIGDARNAVITVNLTNPFDHFYDYRDNDTVGTLIAGGSIGPHLDKFAGIYENVRVVSGKLRVNLVVGASANTDHPHHMFVLISPDANLAFDLETRTYEELWQSGFVPNSTKLYARNDNVVKTASKTVYYNVAHELQAGDDVGNVWDGANAVMPAPQGLNGSVTGPDAKLYAYIVILVNDRRIGTAGNILTVKPSIEITEKLEWTKLQFDDDDNYGGPAEPVL